MFEGMFIFDIDTKSSVSTISYFLGFSSSSANYASLVYKLYITFRTCQDTQAMFILKYI